MAIGKGIFFKNSIEDLLYIFGTISKTVFKISTEYLHFSVYPECLNPCVDPDGGVLPSGEGMR